MTRPGSLLAALLLGTSLTALGEDLPPGHPPVPPSAPSPQQLLEQLDATKDLATREKTFEIAAALGKLYYSHGRFADAVKFLDEAAGKAEPSRKLFLEQRKKAGAKPLPPAAWEPLHALREVESMLANARFITGDAAGALAVHERQLEVFEASPEALYGRAAILLDTRGDDLAALRDAKAGLERFLREAPGSPRAAQAKAFLARVEQAIAAGGVSRLPRGARPSPPSAAPAGGLSPLTPEQIEGIRGTEITDELRQSFAKMLDEAEEHLARGRHQEAMDNYRRVVPFLPDDARAQAGMAWALVALDRQPMADRVWQVAVAADPAALDRLGDLLARKGDPKGARTLWERLAKSAPEYAGAAKLSEKLR